MTAPSGLLAQFLALRARAMERAPAEPGLHLCHELSDALDVALKDLLPADAADVALVALGGYGRRELCLCSDVDLMLLHGGRLPDGLIDAVFYPLWDAGLKLGHAVRSVEEARLAAAERLETLTALLDARRIAGDAELLDRLRERLAALLSRRTPPLEAELGDAVRGRRALEPYQLLATDLKIGRGGLRTLQALGWAARAAALIAGAQPTSEPGAAASARETLLASRNALHAVAGRAQDAWLFDLQAPACRWLGVESDPWCVRLYLALRDVDRLAQARWPNDASAAPPARARRWLRLKSPRREGASASPATYPMRGQPALVLAGALAEGAEPPRFAAEAARSVAAAPGPSWSEAERRGLLAVLRAGERGHEIFEQLDELGWLERALPEWRHVRAAPQHAPFHRHPVDVHLWRTVIEALALAEGRANEPWCRDIGADLGRLDDLLLAALLHDIGKGWPGDHAETGAAAATAFCRRARFDPETMLGVSASVRHHLLLPNVATRRDIADARIIEEVADRAGRARTLRILFVLTVADSRATGPTVWSPWKGSLVRSLFAAALDVLERRSGATPLAAGQPDLLSRLLEAAVGRVPPEVIKAHVAEMAPGYLQSFAVDDVLRHIAVMQSGPDPGLHDVRLDVREDGPVYDLVLVLHDRPGLIALVSGVLALHNLSVIDGRFFTREDGIALQALRAVDALANPVAPERWQRIEADVRRALAGELPLERRLAEKTHAYRSRLRHGQPPDVRIVPDASPQYTVVEVHASDRVGLLFSITDALFSLGLDVHLAKVDTQGNSVVDTFYLRDASGAPLRDAERLQSLRATLLAAVAP